MSPSQKTGNTPRRTHILYSVTFCILGILLYWSALTAYFSSDDFLHIATVMNGKIPFAPQGDGFGFLRPVVGWSFWIEHQLWGRMAFGYHVSNVLVHVINSLLVLRLAESLLPHLAKNREIAVGAGLIFLSMACHAEPVAWISGRTDVLATFFVLLTLCAVSQGIQSGSRRLILISLLPFLTALLTKESAFSLPFLVVAIAAFLRVSDQWAIDKRSLCIALSGAVFLLIAYTALRYWTVGAFVGGYGAHGHLRFYQDLLAQAMSRFVWRIYMPPFPTDTGSTIIEQYGRFLADIFSVVFVLVGLLWTILAWKRPEQRFGFFLYCGFWLALLPVINVRIQWTNVEGERFLYLASVFAAIGAAHLIASIPHNSLRRFVLFAMVVTQGSMLVVAVQRWHTASEFAREIVVGIQALEFEKPVVFANKPDSYNGAMVFRTGLPDAIRYFGPNPREELTIEVLYATTLFEPKHDFSLRPLEGTANTFELTARDPSSVMAEEDRTERIETLSGNQHSYTFRLRRALQHEDFLYYTSTGIHRLKPSP